MTTIYASQAPADLAPSLAAGDTFPLRWVGESRVPPKQHAMMLRHLHALERLHGLPRLTVRYFGAGDGSRADFYATAPEPDMVPLGVTPPQDEYPDTIALHHLVRGEELTARMLAHEVRHVMQQAAGLPSDEADCDAFADRYVRVLGRHGR